MRHLVALLLLWLSSCTGQAANQQTRIAQLLSVSCKVDGVLVPVGQPIVATLGSTGAAVANTDFLLHPAVVAACKAVDGIPASVSPADVASAKPGN